jgi:hypothetical protein
MDDRVDRTDSEIAGKLLGDLATAPALEQGELEDREVSRGVLGAQRAATFPPEQPLRFTPQESQLGRDGGIGDTPIQHCGPAVIQRTTATLCRLLLSQDIQRRGLGNPLEIGEGLGIPAAAKAL